MAGNLRAALALAASEADLFCFRVEEPGVVRLVDGVLLEHGPRASAHAVATIACREIVKDRNKKAPCDEALVRREVESRGFKYMPLMLSHRNEQHPASP